MCERCPTKGSKSSGCDNITQRWGHRCLPPQNHKHFNKSQILQNELGVGNVWVKVVECGKSNKKFIAMSKIVIMRNNVGL